MSKIGTADIKGIMLGSTEISKAYLGSDIVYQNAVPAPEGYEWAEYISNPNNAYINTGIAANTILTVECDMCINSLHGSNERNYLFGATDALSMYQASGGRVCVLRNSSPTYDWGKISSKTHIYVTKGRATVGATSKTINNADITATGNMCIFTVNTSASNIRRGIGSCWGFKLYDANGGLLRNYVPIKRLSDNKYGLWDKVSSTFYGSNNGTSFNGG